MNKLLIGVLCSVAIIACSQPNQTPSDAAVDAEKAIDKSDYTLLAFSSKAISLPGIDLTKHKLTDLAKKCGYRVLPNTGDMLIPGEDLTARKQLRKYASEYNQIILKACINRS